MFITLTIVALITNQLVKFKLVSHGFLVELLEYKIGATDWK